MASTSSIAFNRFQTDDIAAADALLRASEQGLSVVPRPESSRETKPEPTERQVAPETPEQPTPANPLPSDTPATAAEKPQPAAPQQSTETQGEKGSAYAKDQQRLTGTWKQVNEEKARVAAEKAAIQSERMKLQQEQQRVQQQQQSSRNKITAEQYDQLVSQRTESAGALNLQLKGLRAMQKQHEEAGEYKEAAKIDSQIEDMQRKAHVAEYEGDQFKQLAENARKNPDVTGKALEEQTKQHLAHYTVEACKKWPELGKSNSEFQKATAKAINVLRGSGLDENHYPVLRYFAAEHVAAQSAAARVPAMEKELAQANAELKELRAKMSPGGGPTAAANLRPASRPQTLEGEGEALAREAAQIGRRG